MYRICFVLFCCFFLLPMWNVHTAEPFPQLTALQKKSVQYTSFSATFTQQLFNAEAKETEDKTGTLFFKKPMQIVWQVQTPMQEKIVVLEDTIWHYIPEDSIAFKYPIDMLSDIVPFLQIVTGQIDISTVFSPTVQEKTNTTITYLLKPRQDHPIILNVLITINTVTNELTSIKITDYYHNTNSVTFTKFTPNPELEQTIFSFTPPDGTNIIDNSYERAK